MSGSALQGEGAPRAWLDWELQSLFSLRERDQAVENISQITSSYSSLAKKISQYAEITKQLERTKLNQASSTSVTSKLDSQSSTQLRSTLAQQRILELEKKVEELNKERGELYKTQSLNTQKLLEISERTQNNLKIIKKQEQEKFDMEAEIRIRTQKIQDQIETIGEKNKTIEILQDEVTALQLELVHLEDKVAKLWEENQQLVQRWLKKMNEEAEIVNKLNQKDEDRIRQKSLSTMPFNIKSNFLNASGKVPIRVPTSAIRKIDTKCNEIHSIAVSPLSNLLAAGGDGNEVSLFDPETGQNKGKVMGCTSSIFDIQFNSFGTLLAAACGDNSIYIWNAESRSLIKVLTGHISRVVAIKFNQDSTKVISCSQDRTVKVWDVESGNCLKTLFTISNCNDLCLLDNEGTTIATGHMDFGVRAWNTLTGAKVKEIKAHKDAIVSLAVSQNQQQILACSRDGTISVLDASSFEKIWTLTASGFIPHSQWSKVCYSFNDQYASAGSTNGTLYFWDLQNGGTLVDQLRVHKTAVTGIDWSNNKGKMYSSELKRYLLVLE